MDDRTVYFWEKISHPDWATYCRFNLSKFNEKEGKEKYIAILKVKDFDYSTWLPSTIHRKHEYNDIHKFII